jgi:hypothetical protein
MSLKLMGLPPKLMGKNNQRLQYPYALQHFFSVKI